MAGDPRDTMKPAFDVEKYAESLTGRERMATIVDEEATEQARIASVLMDSNPPAMPAVASDVEIIASQPPKFGDLGSEPAPPLEAADEVAFYRARLAPMSRVPSLVRPITELGGVIEDPKTAFVLGFVDGLLPLDTIVEVAGLPEAEALRILDRAIGQYVIAFRQQAF